MEVPACLCFEWSSVEVPACLCFEWSSVEVPACLCFEWSSVEGAAAACLCLEWSSVEVPAAAAASTAPARVRAQEPERRGGCGRGGAGNHEERRKREKNKEGKRLKKKKSDDGKFAVKLAKPATTACAGEKRKPMETLSFSKRRAALGHPISTPSIHLIHLTHRRSQLRAGRGRRGRACGTFWKENNGERGRRRSGLFGRLAKFFSEVVSTRHDPPFF